MRSFSTSVLLLLANVALAGEVSYPIVDTGQVRCYDNHSEISFPKQGNVFWGQDACYQGNVPSYRDNGDGTVSDLVTGLMWTQDPGKKLTVRQALKAVEECRVGGYSDWRMPTIKELYSLIQFSGVDPNLSRSSTRGLTPFIDTRYFKFSYGDTQKGERIIESQYGTCTWYQGKTMYGNVTMFGVNFADGRIKGYGMRYPRTNGEKQFYFMYVRGNPAYGNNRFEDNCDGTVTDHTTGLTWMKVDSGHLKAGTKRDGRLSWQEALSWAEGLDYAGKSDWRLPNAKELQSIVDYTRSMQCNRSAAINPVFDSSSIRDEGGNHNYPCYWTGTSHVGQRDASAAVYIAFGEAFGWMTNPRSGKSELLDVHGAGAQRSDPKSGDPSQYSGGRGPQGDVVRIYNFARCVRGGSATQRTSGPAPVMTSKENAQRGTRSQRPSFVGRLDRNSDGKVSISEFDGPRQHFSKLDRNGDGYLSEDEAPTVPPRRGR